MNERSAPADLGERKVPVHLANGATVYIWATDVTHEGLKEQIVSGGKAIEFQNAVEAVKGVCEQLAEALKTVAPERFTVEVGFELTVESTGLAAVFVHGNANASLKVTMEWEHGTKT